jgi:hypothetical protein
MKKLTLLLAVISACSVSLAQKEIPGFGKIDIADLKLKDCSFEPGATAMKLFDVQEAEFEFGAYGSRLKTEHRVRIKIFNEKGYTHASIKIPYYSKKGESKFKGLKAIVYNLDENGKLVKQELGNKDFFKEKAIENVKMVNFTFPNLKPGSVIEYTYTKVEKNVFHTDPWLVQDDIPVAYSANIITTPIECILKDKVFGSDTIVHKTYVVGNFNYKRQNHFSKENIRSFRPEPFMSSRKDNLLKVIYLLFPTGNIFADLLSNARYLWNMAGIEFINSKLYKEQVLVPLPGTEKVVDSAKKIPVITDKIAYLYAAIQKQISTDNEQTTGLTDLKEAWSSKDGTSAEINMILLNLLKQCNISAHPLLISTRDNGYIDKDFPSFGQLNGIAVLAYDSTRLFVLDASQKFQTIETPPMNLMNREVLVLAKDSTQWLKVVDKRPLLKQHVNIFADLDSAGLLKGTATLQHFNYAKSVVMDTSGEIKSNNFFDHKTPGLTLLTSQRENYDISGEPLTETIDFSFEPQQTNDFFFINPQFLAAENKNPFTTNSRNTDIDFISNQEHILNLQFSLPANFEVDHLPKNMLVIAPDSSFSYQRTFSTDGKDVYMSQLFTVAKPVFQKNEYDGIFDFFKRMYALRNEEIVIKKKK